MLRYYQDEWCEHPISHPGASVTVLFQFFYHVSFGVFSPFLIMVILKIMKLGEQTSEIKMEQAEDLVLSGKQGEGQQGQHKLKGG